jgi:hypothetical protein
MKPLSEKRYDFELNAVASDRGFTVKKIKGVYHRGPWYIIYKDSKSDLWRAIPRKYQLWKEIEESNQKWTIIYSIGEKSFSKPISSGWRMATSELKKIAEENNDI